MGAEHAALQQDEVRQPADELERPVRPGQRRPRDRVRLPDPDRRRGALPQQEEPEPEDHRPLRADPAAVRRDRQPAQAAAAARQEVLGRRLRRDQPFRERRRYGRQRLAVPDQPAGGRRQGAGRRHHPAGGRHRMGRHVDARHQREAPELRVHVGEVDQRAAAAGPAGAVLRRDPRQQARVRGHGVDRAGLLQAVPRGCVGRVLRSDQVLEDADRAVP